MHLKRVITVIAFWPRLGHLLLGGPHWTGYEEVEERRGENAAGATSDLPSSQNSRPKVAGGCQATLSLSQQEAESHKKKTLITQQRRLTKSSSAAQAAAGRPFPVAPVGSSHLPAITLLAVWHHRHQPAASRCVCTTNEKHFWGCSIFGLFSATSIFKQFDKYIFFEILFSCGERPLSVVCLENLFGCEFP